MSSQTPSACSRRNCAGSTPSCSRARIITASPPAARSPWTERRSRARSRSASARIRISPSSAPRQTPSRTGRSSSRPARSRATPWPPRSSASARSSTCIFTMPWPPSSRSRAWTWTAPFSPAATTRARPTTSTVPWIRRSTPLSCRSCATQRKRPSTALTTARSLRAVCRSRSWPAVGRTPCATARSSRSVCVTRAPGKTTMPSCSSGVTMPRAHCIISSAFRHI